MHLRARREAFRIALIYVIVAATWTVSTGALLKWFTSDLGEGVAIDIIKDCGFMILTAALLFQLLRRLLQRTYQVIERQNESETNLRHTERALKTISACNGALVRASNESTLLTEICRVVVEKGGYRMAWVGFPENDQQKSVRVAAQAGDHSSFLNGFTVNWDEKNPRGRGPTGIAVRTGKVALSDDFQTDPNIAPWRAEAIQHGLACSISLPLVNGQKTFGVLTIYASEIHAFHLTDVELLKELAADLSYGIQALRTKIERAEAEKAQQLFRALIERSSDGIHVVDPMTGRFLDANESACRALGYTRDELLALTAFDVAVGLDLAAFTSTNIEMKAAGGITLEITHRRKNGTTFPVEISLSPVSLDREYLVAITRDITLRHQTEEALRQNEKKFSGIFHSSPVAVSISTIKEGRYLDANKEFLQMVERSRDEVIGHTSFELNIWADPGQRAALAARLEKDQSARNAEVNVRTKSGRIRAVSWSVEKLVVNGEICWLGSALDVTENKQAEESLRQSETFVRSVLDSLTAHIAVLDEHGTIVAVNQAWRRFAAENGNNNAQLLGANYLAICQPGLDGAADQFAGAVRVGLQAVMSGRQPSFHFEYPCHSPTVQRWFLMNVWPLGGTGKGVVVSHENITERKQTERLLAFVAQEGWSRPQDDYFIRLVEYIGQNLPVDYVFIGRLKDEQTIRTTGLYGKGGILPDTEYSTRASPCDNVIGKVLCHYGDHLQELFPGDPLLAEMGVQSYLGIPLTDSEGKPLGLMAVLDTKPMPDARLAQAILHIAAVRVAGEIERQAKVEELRWKTALMEAQMEAAPDGILMIDNQRRRILQNRRMNEMLKIPQHIYENKDNAVQVDFVASRAKKPWQLKDKIAYLYDHPDEVSRDELEFLDGTIVDRYSSPVRDKTGISWGRIWTFRDVTQARQLEAQLRQSQKMEAIGQLAGGVAHDFNNILCALLMQTELVETVENLPDEAGEGLKQIRADANRAADLTRQLLLFSRRQVIQPRVLDLNDVVTNLAKMLQRIIGEDVRLQMQLHTSPLMIRADAGMMDQVLMNLVVNARDAMPEGGRLNIETAEKIVTENNAGLYPNRPLGRYVCLSVSDTGTGIPPEIVSRIFEPFFTTKGSGKGTGLGLSTVFGIIEQHHGWITLDNNPGEGVTFLVYLPLNHAMPAATSQTEFKAKLRGGKETILLVEDEMAVSKLIRTLLERRGYTVIAAANGVEAMEKWTQHHQKVSLLLTDLVMPGGLSGQELGHQLQAAQPNLKVIYISGYSAEIGGRELELHQGENFLQKPFAADRLIETVRRSLDE